MARPAVSISPLVLVEPAPKLAPSDGRPLALASDGSGWLVAYRDGQPGTTFLRAIGADGIPKGVPVPLVYGVVDTVHLAFDGTSYVVAWEDHPVFGEKWHLQRIGVDGTPGAAIDAFQNIQSGVQQLALAGGDQSTLAVACDLSCHARVITPAGVAAGASLPKTISSPGAGYSDGTWLVVTVAGDGLHLAQLDATGAVIDGTEKALGNAGAFLPSVVATPDGFAVAWSEGSIVRVATVDFDGAVGPVADVTPPGDSFSYVPRLEAFGGDHYLFAQCNGCVDPPVLQKLDANFVPSGELITDFPAAAMFAESSSSGVFGVEWVGDHWAEGSLLHFGQSITADSAQTISVNVRSQTQLLGAPAPGGWLVAWNEDPFDGSQPPSLMAARLDDAGTPLAAPFALAELNASDALMDLERGPSGWLFSTLQVHGAKLRFLADGDSALSPVLSSSEQGLQLASSSAGWAALAQESNDSVVLYRVDAQGQYIDQTTVLPPGSAWFAGVESDGSGYLIWWTDLDGNGWSRHIPGSGAIPDGTATKLGPEGSFYYWRYAGGTWWGATSKSIWEGGHVHSLEQTWESMQVFRGAALLLAPAEGNATEVFPATLGVLDAAPGAGVTKLDAAPPAFEAHFSQPNENRVLMLGYSRRVPYNRVLGQRAVVSVIEVADVADGGAGGVGGEGSGNNGGMPAEGGTTTSTDGGGTTPADAGNGTGGTDANQAGNGGRGGSVGNLDEGGVFDEGDDTVPPSDGGASDGTSASGPHHSKGCGCRAAGTDVSGSNGSALPLLLLGALAVRRRRIIPS